MARLAHGLAGHDASYWTRVQQSKRLRLLLERTDQELFFDNLLLRPRFELPSVFAFDGVTNSVNGSLWTLPYEACAYLILGACFLIGIFRCKALSLALGVLLIIDPFFNNKLLLTWLPQQHWINMLPPCFAFGSILALFKDKIQISAGLLVGLYVLLFVFRKSAYVVYFFYAATFCSILYVSSLAVLLRLKPRVDISYGVYLWGFPVQQILARLYPTQGPVFNQILGVVISMALGYLSWHLIEKHGIRLGAKLASRLPQSGLRRTLNAASSQAKS